MELDLTQFQGTFLDSSSKCHDLGIFRVEDFTLGDCDEQCNKFQGMSVTVKLRDMSLNVSQLGRFAPQLCENQLWLLNDLLQPWRIGVI